MIYCKYLQKQVTAASSKGQWLSWVILSENTGSLFCACCCVGVLNVAMVIARQEKATDDCIAVETAHRCTHITTESVP